MMAGVVGNVIALVFSVLVALPVAPESAALSSDVLLRDRSALAVDTCGSPTSNRRCSDGPVFRGLTGMLR